ncbi:hypothetical protein MKK58_03225 [Methylobacterium sp. J-078]|uniref:hypothetical protein n=1 Tax=Methylobacterium sp. J-078 TaxID=2836657 RepID=UPI001FB983E9|nr:hypothetical protein [Methylobacterium sp. J-078]MCJ2043550.1 hypothetical protein [Methylobacterium sp. J-078]
MWTTANRGGYDRNVLRHESDLTDAEVNLSAGIIDSQSVKGVEEMALDRSSRL